MNTRCLTALLGMLLTWPTALAAQETTGDIHGRLAGPDSAAIAGADVTATGDHLLGERRAVSSADGVFLLLRLPPGRYRVSAHHIGFRPLGVVDVVVQLGRTSGLGTLTMQPASVQLDELTVTAPGTMLDPVNTTVGTVIEAADYAALPGERDYKSLMTILPHANTSYNGDPVNAGGATGLENAFFIDGVNVTAPYRGTGGTSLPYNFVRSVEVRTGGYGAQFGRALGAIVNAVTYTGTNQLEANLFAFGTHGALSSRAKVQPNLRETGSYSYDVGARVSGPVIRNRLWFSVAYNPRLTHVDREVAGLGTYSDDSRADIFAGKLTWRALPMVNVEASVFGDPKTHHEVDAELPELFQLTPLNADPYLHRVQTGGTTYSVRATATVGSAVLVEVAWGRSSGRENFEAETATGRNTPPFEDHVAGTVSGGVAWPFRVSQHTTSAMAQATLTLGRHRTVVGAEVEHTDMYRALWAGAGLGLIDRDSTGYHLHKEGAAGTFRNHAPAAYIQDEWRLTRRVTVSPGLRWSHQQLFGASGGHAREFTAEWQPRLGFSVDVGSAGAQRIFGSYGRFYQQQPLNLTSLYFTDYLFISYLYRQDPRLAGSVPYDSAGGLYPESDTSYGRGQVSLERYDEFTLGYERLVGAAAHLTLRAIHRHLGTAYQQGCSRFRDRCWLGNPGHGDLTFLPEARRDYSALEISLEGRWRTVQYRAYYVFSKNWGNYPGLYGADFYYPNPGIDYGLTVPSQGTNSTGYLPNDRTHVLKLVATWQPQRAVTVGTFLTWQTGTPINALGVPPDSECSSGCTWFPTFVAPRGSVGRLPAVVDLNIRLSYDAAIMPRARTRLVFDALHVGNWQSTVRVDQQYWFDAAKAVANARYRQATAFLPPMAARLGAEVSF